MTDVDVCALCGLESALQKSHILPEFLYDEIYDVDDTFRVHSTERAKVNRRARKGIYERLLCMECDQRRLGRLDDYAAKVLKGGIELEMSDQPSRLTIGGLDYQLFKLWQMSLLWRCGISTRREFGATRLGPHAEVVRKLLLEAHPGHPHEYGCIVILPSSHEMTRQLIYPPEPVRVADHKCYRAGFGSLWWIFVVSSRSADFPFQEGFLSERGVLPIFKEANLTSTFLHRLLAEIGTPKVETPPERWLGLELDAGGR